MMEPPPLSFLDSAATEEMSGLPTAEYFVLNWQRMKMENFSATRVRYAARATL
jgi:hypothetical protein